MPRLLAITTEHFSGDILLGPRAADFLLTSDTKIEVPIGKPIDEIGIVTDLKDSVFFRLGNGGLESCRRSISAIFLVHILADKCSIHGVLHPDFSILYLIVNKILRIVIADYGTKSKPQTWGKWEVVGGF